MDKTKSRPAQLPNPSSISKSYSAQLPKWILLPLRLFLGITFVYAGIQKLTDPQFFNPSATGYIGKQILAFAHGSPIQGILLQLALPHATFFGLVIALGEIAIGLGTLFGFLLRPAAFFGAALSLLFYLSASWHVYPYFYGADIVFIFCWLTMLLAGPAGSGLPAVDTLLAEFLLENRTPEQQQKLTPVLSFFLGVQEKPVAVVAQQGNMVAGKQTTQRNRQPTQRGRQAMQLAQQSRRSFIWGLVTGGTGIAGIALFWRLLTGSSANDATNSGLGSTATITPAATAGSTQVAGGAIAQVSQVAVNNAVTFTIPSNNDPGVLVHLNNGQFVAFDALCTHAGCQVQYDPGSQLLLCPCHGAEFDPAKNATPSQNGPTNIPLTGVPIHVDSASGNITLSNG